MREASCRAFDENPSSSLSLLCLSLSLSLEARKEKEQGAKEGHRQETDKKTHECTLASLAKSSAETETLDADPPPESSAR